MGFVRFVGPVEFVAFVFAGSASRETRACSHVTEQNENLQVLPFRREYIGSGCAIAHALLRNGQKTQLTAASDPISGETMRVDVTLTVIK